MTEPATKRPDHRIAKLLARAGIASRREVERMIEEGRVALDGVVLTTPATVVRSLAGVTVDGQPVAAPPPARLFVHHKPPGLLVTERDPAGRPTIYDRLPRELPRLVPVGRLDLATEGLLLLTTDGGLKRQLELPATGVERTYRARAYGEVTQAQLEALIEGVEVDGVRYGPIDANLERRTGANVWIELTLTEGKNREVRRVLEHLGLQVGRLIRTRYGPFVLGDLQPGQVGEVRQHDLVAFRRQLERNQKPEHLVAVTPFEPAAPTPPPVERPARIRPVRGAAAEPGKARPPRTVPRRENLDRDTRPTNRMERGRGRPDRAVPAGDRPDRTAPARTGERPARTAPRRDENGRDERPLRAHADRTERGGGRPGRAAPAGDRPDRAAPARTGERPARTGTTRTGPAKTGPTKTGPTKTGPGRQWSDRAAPADARAERGRAEDQRSGRRTRGQEDAITTRPPRPAPVRDGGTARPGPRSRTRPGGDGAPRPPRPGAGPRGPRR